MKNLFNRLVSLIMAIPIFIMLVFLFFYNVFKTWKLIDKYDLLEDKK